MTNFEPTEINLQDAEALDFLIASGFDPASIDRMPTHVRDRARKLLEALQAIDDYPVAPPSTLLVDATLARIAQNERQRADRMTLTSTPAMSLRRRMGIPNFVAVAAMLIVGTAVAIPITNEVRNNQSQSMCASGLRNLGGALSAYAADNRGILPMTASLGSFLTNQTDQSSDVTENARHLELLSTHGYCDHKCTRCNGSRNLAYRVPMHKSQVNLASSGRSPIAADSNPIQAHVRQGVLPRSFDLDSLNHNQRGQNVLFSDGSVVWMSSPILQNGPLRLPDNIWIIREKNGAESWNLRANTGSPLEIILMN